MLEITWLIPKCTPGKAGFTYTGETAFLKFKAFGEAVGFFSHWEFKHMEICSSQALSLLHDTVLVSHF